MLIAQLLMKKKRFYRLWRVVFYVYMIQKRQQNQDFPNPALGLTEGRRGATLRFAEGKGAKVFVTTRIRFASFLTKLHKRTR